MKPQQCSKRKKCFVALLQEHIGIVHKLIKLHCIIHQDALCSKPLNIKDTMTGCGNSAFNTVTVIQSSMQFQECLELKPSLVTFQICDDVAEENAGTRAEWSVLCFRRAMTKLVLNFRIQRGLLTQHFNGQHDLHGHFEPSRKKKLIYVIVGQINAFERKLRLSESHRQKGNDSNFRNLQNHARTLFGI